MKKIILSDAKQDLVSLIASLLPGEEMLIVENDQPVARLTKLAGAARERMLGTMAGSVMYLADDFDAPLDGFADDGP